MIGYSDRIPEGFEPNPLHRLLAAHRAAGSAILDLTESNPTRVGLPAPPAEAWEQLVAGARAPYDPAPLGLPLARRAVSAYYADRGLPVPEERVILTSSTSEAYAHLFRILAHAGDEFLVPEPSYPLFGPLAALEAVRLVSYPLCYEDAGWRIDLAALAQAAGPRTRAMVVVHPNNPTGSLIREEEAQTLETLCADRGLALVADEVFADFAFPRSPRRASFAASSRCLSFSLGGLSKACGLPHAKLAWIACSGPEDEVPRALAALEWVSDAFLSVSSPIQRALPALLATRRPFLEATRARLVANLAALDAAGIERLAWEGGWSAVLRLPPTRTDEEWALAFLERGVLVMPGHFFDFRDDRHLVVSLLPEPAIFAEGVLRIVETLGTG